MEERFGIETLDYQQGDATAILRLPIRGLRNPITNEPTLAPLALLVDDAGSTATYACRGRRWRVTSELSMQFVAGAESLVECGLDEYVLANARILSATPGSALAECTLMFGPKLIGVATVRSVYISGHVATTHRPSETLVKTSCTSLAELMAVTPSPDAISRYTLKQLPDPMVFNAKGTVHGGVSATAAELVASAAIWGETSGGGFRSGSLHVNFLRPFIADADSCYRGSVVHAGSTVAVAEAQAIASNGKIVVTAQFTEYR